MDHTSVRLYNYIENCCEYVYVYVCVCVCVCVCIFIYKQLCTPSSANRGVYNYPQTLIWICDFLYLFIPLPLPPLQPSMPHPKTNYEPILQSVSPMILFLEFVSQSPTRKAESSHFKLREFNEVNSLHSS